MCVCVYVSTFTNPLTRAVFREATAVLGEMFGCESAGEPESGATFSSPLFWSKFQTKSTDWNQQITAKGSQFGCPKFDYILETSISHTPKEGLFRADQNGLQKINQALKTIAQFWKVCFLSVFY